MFFSAADILLMLIIKYCPMAANLVALDAYNIIEGVF